MRQISDDTFLGDEITMADSATPDSDKEISAILESVYLFTYYTVKPILATLFSLAGPQR